MYSKTESTEFVKKTKDKITIHEIITFTIRLLRIFTDLIVFSKITDNTTQILFFSFFNGPFCHI